MFHIVDFFLLRILFLSVFSLIWFLFSNDKFSLQKYSKNRTVTNFFINILWIYKQGQIYRSFLSITSFKRYLSPVAVPMELMNWMS